MKVVHKQELCEIHYFEIDSEGFCEGLLGAPSFGEPQGLRNRVSYEEFTRLARD